MTRMQNENLNDNSYTASEQLKPNKIKSWEHKLPPKSIYKKQQKAGLIIL